MASGYDHITFKDEIEKPVSRRATEEPECMKNLDNHIDMGRNQLSTEEMKVAKEQLLQKDFIRLDFPRKMKFHVDPVLPSQDLALITFIPSTGAEPDKDGCYGVLKVRGTFENEHKADAWSDNLIRNHDSYSDIHYCHVGRFVPLTRDNTPYCNATKEIDIRRKIDDTVKQDIKTKREIEKQEMASVQERYRALMADVSEEKERTFDDLEHYTQLKTKKASLLYNLEELHRKIKESEELVEKASRELSILDEKFPEYKNEFMDRYNEALKSSGIDPAKNPLIKFMAD